VLSIRQLTFGCVQQSVPNQIGTRIEILIDVSPRSIRIYKSPERVNGPVDKGFIPGSVASMSPTRVRSSASTGCIGIETRKSSSLRDTSTHGFAFCA
jgi:hypothetical protein